MRLKISAYWLVLLAALFIAATANVTFFTKVVQLYPFWTQPMFVLSAGVALVGALLFLLLLFSYRYTIKAVLIVFLMIAAVSGHFTDSYGTVYDVQMLQNALQTDAAETADLLNVPFVLRVLLLGVLPSVLVARCQIVFADFKKNALQRVGWLLLSLAMAALPIASFGGQFASFFRVHKPVRYYINPLTPMYAAGKLANIHLKKLREPKDTIMHAADATKADSDRKPRLVVMVVGETARADHVPMNGYARNTFEQLSAMSDVANFGAVTACGTSTAYSVPCMFSYLGAQDFDVDTARFHENVIDTLHRVGVAVLWRDNNSDDKGVMDKLPDGHYVDFRTDATNPNCQNAHQECRDVGMLADLDAWVLANDGKDALIVLHQMGNHGPAYFKRYDEAFAKFTPVCHSNELSKCDKDALINGYDNALLATDDFLAKTIAWLKTHSDSREVAMLYASDHGESLGEKGIYLHGLPYAFAPMEQKQVPAFFWQHGTPFVASEGEFSHDAITPTLLKLFDVQTAAVAQKSAFIR